MNLIEVIATKTATLPLEKQREVLDFVEFVLQRTQPGQTPEPGANPEAKKPPFRSVPGALARPGVDVTPDDIAQVRREMWQNFPREEPR